MTRSKFYTQLGVVAAIVALILLLLNQFDLFATHQAFSLVSWAVFIAFCLSIYSISVKTMDSPDKTLFSKVFLISIMVKMFLSLTLIITYILAIKPQDKYFVFPFFISYVFFTIYEVYFITKLAKS